MPETTQINVKLPVPMKKEWENYLENNDEATSISHLVRLAVSREINEETRRPTEVELDSDDVELDVNIEGVERRLDEMENTLHEVRDTVTAMETGQLADEDQIEDIADRVYDTIPRRTSKRMDDGPELSPREIADELVQDAVTYLDERNKTHEDLADEQNFDYGLVDVYQEYFGVNDYVMQQVLDRVEQMSSRVHVHTDFQNPVVFEVE